MGTQKNAVAGNRILIHRGIRDTKRRNDRAVWMIMDMINTIEVSTTSTVGSDSDCL